MKDKCVNYGEWLDGHSQRLLDQEINKESDSMQEFRSCVTQELLKKEDSTILEIGCGTGVLPTTIPLIGSINYLGVTDSCTEFNMAVKKCPMAQFLLMDMRGIDRIKMDADIVCSKDIIKNFPQKEMDNLIKAFLLKGNIGIFTVPVGKVKAKECRDYLTEEHFHHSWISIKQLKWAIERAGHRLVTPTKDIIEGRDNLIITRRKK